MNLRIGTLAILLLAVCTGAAATSAAGEPPSSLTGEWVIRHVAIDARAGMRSTYETDDPHLLGEVLAIHADGHIDYPLANPCPVMTWRASPRITLAALVGTHAKEGGGGGGPRTRPTLNDYGLKLGNPVVTPLVPLCRPAAAPATTAPWDAADWFVSLTPNRLAMGNGVDAVIVLDRLTASTPITPSFACKGSLSPTEAAICKSQALAGRDRAVASAYRRAQKLGRMRKLDNSNALRDQQAQWLKTRDACVQDADCIIDRMRERITALMSN